LFNISFSRTNLAGGTVFQNSATGSVAADRGLASAMKNEVDWKINLDAGGKSCYGCRSAIDGVNVFYNRPVVFLSGFQCLYR